MTQRRIYQDEYPYFVTIRTKENIPLFDNIEYAILFAKVIYKKCRIKHFDVLSYQIMPDHVHLLIIHKYHQAQPAVVARHFNKKTSAGTAARARRIFNISELIHGIKSYYYSQMNDQYGINFQFFQPRFYSRIVNDNKYLKNTIHYIKHNPVKENLPSKYRQSPYQYFDWGKINNLF